MSVLALTLGYAADTTCRASKQRLPDRKIPGIRLVLELCDRRRFKVDAACFNFLVHLTKVPKLIVGLKGNNNMKHLLIFKALVSGLALVGQASSSTVYNVVERDLASEIWDDIKEAATCAGCQVWFATPFGQHNGRNMGPVVAN